MYVAVTKDACNAVDERFMEASHTNKEKVGLNCSPTFYLGEGGELKFFFKVLLLFALYYYLLP